MSPQSNNSRQTPVNHVALQAVSTVSGITQKPSKVLPPHHLHWLMGGAGVTVDPVGLSLGPPLHIGKNNSPWREEHEHPEGAKAWSISELLAHVPKTARPLYLHLPSRLLMAHLPLPLPAHTLSSSLWYCYNQEGLFCMLSKPSTADYTLHLS